VAGDSLVNFTKAALLSLVFHLVVPSFRYCVEYPTAPGTAVQLIFAVEEVILLAVIPVGGSHAGLTVSQNWQINPPRST